MSTLADVEREALACTRCRLTEGRTQVVFGVGSSHADLMLVGEGPGAQEDIEGMPFVGRSGRYLDRLVLEEMGLTRADLYIANTVKCLGYSATVQLADGSWERIGRLVRERYDGEVKSITDDGRIVARRVVGWHATPLAGRRVYRMTLRSATPAGLGRGSVELTGDHPVLTPDGFRPVGTLESGALVATGQGLSPLANDVVVGTLLGDGHLGRERAHVSFSHSLEQIDYALFKAGLLGELHPRVSSHAVAAVAGDQARSDVVMVETLAHGALRTLRREFYTEVKRVPPWVALIPFDPDGFVPGDPLVGYDEVEIEDITDRPRTDTTFFCIDVEETHNFVTGAGVVHNCRPPGNRDPLPDEVASCSPWLGQQLDLVDPSVVVTLGNFATRLLLRTTEGITRLRGKVYPFRRGVLVPTYHPAAVLRSGGEAAAQMRADLVRAKKHLRAPVPV